MDPGQQISAILHRAFQKIYLGTKSMVRNYHDPASVKAVADLVFIDHSRRPKHEGPAVNINNFQG